MLKNTAGPWRVFAFNLATGEPVTGDAAQITAKLSIDGGELTATDDVNPTETEDGFYVFDMTAAERNGDDLDLYPESSTTGVRVIGVPGHISPQQATIEQIIAAITSGGSYPILWPLTDTESETRELDRRDDYTDAAPILIDVATAHDLQAEGVTISFEAKRNAATFSGTGTVDTVIDAEAGQYRIAVKITQSQTDQSEATYTWKLIARLANGDRHTLRRGCFRIV